MVHVRVLCSCAHEVRGQGTPLTLAVLFPDTLPAELCRKDCFVSRHTTSRAVRKGLALLPPGNGDGDKLHEQQRVTLTGQPA